MKLLYTLVLLLSFFITGFFNNIMQAEEFEVPQLLAHSFVRDNDSILLEEHFTDSIPGDWTQIRYNNTSKYWVHNQGTFPIPNSDGRYLIADYYASNGPYNVGLFTRAIDISGLEFVLVDFDRNLNFFYGSDTGMVRGYSGGTDSSFRVDTLWSRFTTDEEGGAHTTVVLEPENYSDPSEIYLEFYVQSDNWSSVRFGIDNLIIQTADFGYLEGYVFDSLQNPVADAEVGVKQINKKVFTDNTGYYNFGRIPVGVSKVYAKKSGINEDADFVTVNSGQTANLDFTLYHPWLTISPDTIVDTLNPNETYIDSLYFVNSGSGDAHWQLDDAYSYPWWLTFDTTQGTTLAESNDYFTFTLSSNNMSSGIIEQDLHFKVEPGIDTIMRHIKMVISGTPLGIISGQANFIDEAFGISKLTWTMTGTGATLEYFIIERDNMIIDTVTTYYCIDTLPDFGSYEYKITPVFDQGTGITARYIWLAWIIPVLNIEPETLTVNTWSNALLVEPILFSNVDYGEAYYEFEGFQDPDYGQDFISLVAPYNGRVAHNGQQTNYLTIDADGYAPGDYNTVLTVTSTEPDSVNTHYVVVNMHVSVPGSFSGNVNDCDNEMVLNGVEIQAMNLQDSSEFVDYSDASGYYHLFVDAGDYQLMFIKPGYDTVLVDSVNAPAGITQIQSAQLCMTTFTPGWVKAQVNDADNSCEVNWNMPTGLYNIIYDDGFAEDFFLCDQPGDQVAVRFTPANYPVIVTGGSVYVGKGTETVNKTAFFDREVIIALLDDNGDTGMPGTILDTARIKVTNFGWVTFESVFHSRIDSGDFYLSVIQLNDSIFSLPVGIDQSFLDNRSYFKSISSVWELSNMQGLMIRADVDGPMQNPNRAFTNFKLVRFDDFDPDAGETPQDGTGSLLVNNTTDLSFTDADFGNLQMGWHAYGIKSVYETGTSDWKFSNIVGHLMDVSATVTVEQCDSLTPKDAYITFTGKNYPWDVYIEQTDTNGVAFFDSIIKGTYNIKIYKPGYKPVYFNDILIMDHYSIATILEENAYPARNLYVDSLTSVATWDEPLVTALPLETFEDTLFPPPGWQVSDDQCTVWHRACEDEPFYDWIVPEWEGCYALYNDDAAGCCPDADIDYLVTPAFDLRESENFNLSFDRFFDALYGGYATVAYSIDNGASWNILIELAAASEWKKDNIDLSLISGEDGLDNVRLAFVFNDGGEWAGGWALDNVEISSDPAPVKKYFISLNGFPVATLPPDQHSYTFENLEFGHYYTAAVRAGYSCGISERIEYSWQSGFLYQPRNLVLDYTDNTNDVFLSWNPPEDNSAVVIPGRGMIPNGLLSYNIYRNDDSLTNIPYKGEQPDDLMMYYDRDILPGNYIYKITALYDLTSYGYPDQIGESEPSNIDTVEVKWGFDLPFEETWEVPDFNFNSWNTDTAYWRINSEIGHEAPSAMFEGDATLDSNYSVSLISVPFRADNAKLDKYFYLDYDLKLESNSLTGLDTLSVEVYNGKKWVLLEEFINNEPVDFGEEPFRINLTSFVINRIFRVRFRASGIQAGNATWYVDNISVYGKCDFPSNLTGKYVWNDSEEDNDFGAEICWEPPEIPGSLWLFWGHRENYSSTGLADGGDFSVAIRWEPDQIAGLIDDQITEVSFYLNSTEFDAILVRIWKGVNAFNLIYENVVTSMVVVGWNTITLDTPVPVDVEKELWVGYTILGQQPGTMPAGIDAGPAVIGYGDKITTDGYNWNNLSDYGLSFNWNIAAHIEALPENAEPLKPLVDNTVYHTPNATLVLGEVNRSENQQTFKSREVKLSGFKVYRSETGQEGSYLNYAIVPYEEGALSYCFEDKYPNVEPQNVYWYKVSAQWIDSGDTCESDFAKAKDIPEDNFVNVLVTDVEHLKDQDDLMIYPNPAANRVTIDAKAIQKITAFNYVGQKVYDKSFNNESIVTLNAENFDAGIYLFRIKTAESTTVKRVIILK